MMMMIMMMIIGDLLPALPHHLAAEGKINPESVIIGANQDEGLLDTLNFILDPSLYDTFRKGMFIGNLLLLQDPIFLLFIVDNIASSCCDISKLV